MKDVLPNINNKEDESSSPTAKAPVEMSSTEPATDNHSSSSSSSPPSTNKVLRDEKVSAASVVAHHNGAHHDQSLTRHSTTNEQDNRLKEAESKQGGSFTSKHTSTTSSRAGLRAGGAKKYDNKQSAATNGTFSSQRLDRARSRHADDVDAKAAAAAAAEQRLSNPASSAQSRHELKQSIMMGDSPIDLESITRAHSQMIEPPPPPEEQVSSSQPGAFRQRGIDSGATNGMTDSLIDMENLSSSFFTGSETFSSASNHSNDAPLQSMSERLDMTMPVPLQGELAPELRDVEETINERVERQFQERIAEEELRARSAASPYTAPCPCGPSTSIGGKC